jgi:hypothetical protein
LSRCSKRIRVARTQVGQGRRVDDGVERRLRLGLGELLGASGQAVAAVAARLGARLAEVGDEGLHLTAVVGDEREDVLYSLGLRALAAAEALEQMLDELALRIGACRDRIALSHLGRGQLNEP